MPIIDVPAVHYNISPALFHEYALQYLQCKRAFKTSARYSPIPYFLICRAIELELKAKHLDTKSREEVKNQYRHNLKKSYDELPDSHRMLDTSEYNVLVCANKIYITDKGFEYVSVYDAITGLKNFPDLAALEQVATKLIGE